MSEERIKFDDDKNELAAVPPALHVEDFYNLNVVEQALQKEGFNVTEEIQLLVMLMRDPDPRVALQAHARFLDRTREMLKFNGLVTTLTQKSTNEQGNVSRIAHAQKLVDRRASRDSANQGRVLPVFIPAAGSRVTDEADDTPGVTAGGSPSSPE